jgi:hypothetical protein
MAARPQPRTPPRTPLRQPNGQRPSRLPTHPDDVLKRLARSPNNVTVLPSFESQRRRKPPTNPYTIGLWAIFGFVGVIGIVPWLVPNRPSFTIEGITDRSSLQPTAMLSQVVKIKTSPASAAAKLRISVDGIAVEPNRGEGEATIVLGALPEGSHSINISAGSRILYRGPVSKKVTFNVDGTPPVATATLANQPKTLEDDVTISGTSEPGAKVTVNGRDAKISTDGAYTITFPRAPIGALQIRATDAAGNVGTALMPGVSGKLMPATRGVHVSGAAWSYEPLRTGVLELIDAGKINTVQLDLKDEDGRIGYRTQVPLANQIGASDNLYDLADAVRQLKARNVRIVGRLVVFRDPTLAKSAWGAGNTDQVLQNTDGSPYNGRYGGKFGAFTNPFNTVVRNYNTAVAIEAAQAGVDDILLDYIRRPEAEIETLKFVGVEGPTDSARVSQEIVSYIDELATTLGETPARLGASIFGIAVAEGDRIGQDVTAMSKSLDYIAPMVYPSAWTPGQLGVNNPSAQPYDMVFVSLQEFQKASAGSGVRIIPWLQDFTLGKVKYGDKEVRAQIEASANACISDWLIWDPKVTYSSGGLPVGIQQPTKAPVCP